MSRRWVFVLGLALGLCQAALAVEDMAVVYNGTAELPKTVALGDWGFFPRAELNQPLAPMRVEGVRGRAYGIKVSTVGRHQGMRIDFTPAIDTAAFLNGKNTYLELYLRSVPAATPPPPPVAQPSPDETEYDPMANYDPLAGGTTYTPAAPTAPPPFTILPAVKNLRFTLFTEKGQGLLTIPAAQFAPKEEINKTWSRIDIPLTMVNASLPVGGKLTRMVVSSDEPAEFLIGRMAFVRDAEPIIADVSVFPAFIETNQRVAFTASVKAGLTHYETNWDFDTAAGASVDATGDRATYTYSKEGTYKITCTVRDVYAGKDPVIKTIEIKVNRPVEPEPEPETPAGDEQPQP